MSHLCQDAIIAMKARGVSKDLGIKSLMMFLAYQGQGRGEHETCDPVTHLWDYNERRVEKKKSF